MVIVLVTMNTITYSCSPNLELMDGLINLSLHGLEGDA